MADLSQLDDWGCIPQSLRTIWKRKFPDPLIAVRRKEFNSVWLAQLFLTVLCLAGFVLFAISVITVEATRGNWLIVLPGLFLFFGVILSVASFTALCSPDLERKSSKDFAAMLNSLYEKLEITPSRLANLTGGDIKDLVLWTLLRRAKQIKALEGKGEKGAARLLEIHSFGPLHQIAFDLEFWPEEEWDKMFAVAQGELETLDDPEPAMKARMPDLYPEPHARDPEASSDPAS